MKIKTRSSAVFFLQLFISVYFIASAVIFLSSYDSSGSRFLRGVENLFGQTSHISLVIAVIQLISGIILFLGLFASMKIRTMYLACIVIMILWGINIVMLYIFDSFLQPSLFVWLREFSMQLIILAGLWALIQE